MSRHCRSLFLLALGVLLGAAPAAAQTATGRIVGIVVDQETGQPLPGAQVALLGSERGALAGVDGRYTITNVPAGTHSLLVMFIGHADKTVEGITVRPGEAVQQDVALASSAIEIEGLTVTARRETGTVAGALNEQRSAVGMISSTTSEQITRSPDSDAAEAVRRVSGVSVQDGRYVFVRGLGERYTTTSLNGSRVPSPEPERRVVPLDLFPSNLLEAITTSKTFTPNQPGDFSGAAVDLRTRSFPAERMIQLSVSGGYNTQATGRDMLLPATSGGEWLAAAGDRGLPPTLAAVEDFSALSQAQLNGLIRSLPRDWTAAYGSGLPNASASLSVGGEDPVLGHDVGYVGSLSYSRSHELRDDELRSRAVPADAAGTPAPYNPFTGSTGTSSVLWGGLLNLSTYLGESTKIELNNTYNRTADNAAHVDWGTLEEFAQVDSVRRSSLRYVERSVRSSQLRGEHQLSERNRIEWSFTSSGVTRSEPDRADLAYGYEIAPSGERLPLAWLGFIPEAARRTTSELRENAWSGDLGYALTLGAFERPATLSLGGAWRLTERDANSASYNLRAVGLDAAARAATPDELFYGEYTEGDATGIVLEPNSAGGFYAARDEVTAAYAMAEVPLGDRLRLVGGARVERWNLDMEVEPTSADLLEIGRTSTDVLPSIALNATLSDDQTIRLSASQTLARPEYRELAPIGYRDMLGDREVFGDSSLVRTLVQNYDARWEFYPSYSEVISIGVFAKRFQDPIEPIDVATTGASQLSFINAESALNYGIELELRHGLGFLGERFAPLGVFTNVTLMRSRINTSNSNLSALTNDERPMVGQAPYVVNLGLAYASESGATSGTLLYNVVGERITSAAVAPITVDTYEQPRHQLDFSLRFPLWNGVSGKVDAKNLLDSPYEEMQGDVVRYRYTTGRTFSLGLSWTL